MFLGTIFHVLKVFSEIILNENKWSLKIFDFKDNFKIGKSESQLNISLRLFFITSKNICWMSLNYVT
jgi:hypothetical protein